MRTGKFINIIAAALSFYSFIFILYAVFNGIIEPRTGYLILGLLDIYIMIMSIYELFK